MSAEFVNSWMWIVSIACALSMIVTITFVVHMKRDIKEVRRIRREKAKMTREERIDALRDAFGKWNWSMRMQSVEGHCTIGVFNMNQVKIGHIILNDSGGYYRAPETKEEWLRGLFYSTVDDALHGGHKQPTG